MGVMVPKSGTFYGPLCRRVKYRKLVEDGQKGTDYLVKKVVNRIEVNIMQNKTTSIIKK